MKQSNEQIAIKAIKRIVDYMWDDELTHLQENILCIETYTQRHIFFDLELVNNWLKDKQTSIDRKLED
jgi:hypothetical protein